MARRNTRGKGAKKPPRRAGPPKKKRQKAAEITRSVAAKNAKRAARSATARRREATRGRKATLFAKAMGICPRDCEVLVHGPDGRRVEINGLAEEGVPKGTRCHCLSLLKSSCKKHPSREKIRTGHFIACPTKAYPNKRRAVWVPKVLVDKRIIKVKEDVKFRVNKMNGKAL